MSAVGVVDDCTAIIRAVERLPFLIVMAVVLIAGLMLREM